MNTAVVALTLALAQDPAAPPAPPQTPSELATLDAKLGSCSADFTVKDADGAPLYAATIQVRVRYGALNLKRMDLEISTGSDGKARIAGLPSKAKPLSYEIKKGDLKTAVWQYLDRGCQGAYDITLK